MHPPSSGAPHLCMCQGVPVGTGPLASGPRTDLPATSAPPGCPSKPPPQEVVSNVTGSGCQPCCHPLLFRQVLKGWQELKQQMISWQPLPRVAIPLAHRPQQAGGDSEGLAAVPQDQGRALAEALLPLLQAGPRHSPVSADSPAPGPGQAPSAATPQAAPVPTPRQVLGPP